MNIIPFEIDEKNKIYEGLKNPNWVNTLYKAIKFEENLPPNEQDMGWEWWEVQSHPNTLKKMVEYQLLYITHGGKRILFKVNPTAQKILEEEIQTEQQTQSQFQNNTDISIPNNLFANIIGHSRLKWLLNKAIKAQEPCHVLLYGEPATAKTLFLGELARLPNSKFLLGSSTSKAGLTDYLLEYQPTYLILDEIDKVKKEDLSVLLSLMEGGKISKLKKRINKTIHLQTWVFGSANRINHLPLELKSRFWTYYVAPYNEKDFKAVSQNLLKNYFNDETIIEYIIEKVSNYTRDVRTIQKVGKLCTTKEDVDYLLDML